MLLEKPLFLKNPEWYVHDDERNMYLLTDKAPKEAQQSYIEFYETLNNSYWHSQEFKIKDINDYIVKTTQDK